MMHTIQSAARHARPPRRWAPIGVLVVLSTCATPARADFVRGDANRDERVDVLDVVLGLRALFDGVELGCLDAADSNDDGRISIEDALATLSSRFGGPGLPYPDGPTSGPDPTCDGLGCRDSAVTSGAIVINEIQYNPSGNQLNEFIELHNRTSIDIRIDGYALSGGIRYTVPEQTTIPAGGYVGVFRAPTRSTWRNVPDPKLGPFELTLANGGERLTLRDGDCTLESVRYDDRGPWPIGADGYGPSLERVEAAAPADDHHSWRVSFESAGTPAAPNSTVGIPTHPVVVSATVDPAHPGSTDPVRVDVTLDLPPQAFRAATLRWEVLSDTLREAESALLSQTTPPTETSTVFTTVLPPIPSQSMVRYNVEVELSDGTTLVLPHAAGPAPMFSFFVYDDEVPSILPIFWIFSPRPSGIIDGSPALAGIAIREPDAPAPQVFDGAIVSRSNQGLKARFLKGAEYAGNRTLNILPERGAERAGGGVGGPFAPHFEQFGYETYRSVGALAPRTWWFRLINFATPDPAQRHTQRVVFQQVNESFFELSGVDPDGDLYKLEHGSFSKRTNPETGTARLNALLQKLGSSDPDEVRATVLEKIDRESFRDHAVGAMLIGHTDNFDNNLFIYDDLSPGGTWKMVPWDLDTTFQSADTFSLDAPKGGTVSAAFHAQPDLDLEFREQIKAQITEDGAFTLERATGRATAVEQLLLDDLELLEAYEGADRNERRLQIRQAYLTIRQYIARRRSYLLGRVR